MNFKHYFQSKQGVIWVTMGVVFFITLLVSVCVAVCIRNRRLRQATLYQQALAANYNNQYMIPQQNRTSFAPSLPPNPQPIYSYTNLPPRSANPNMSGPPPTYNPSMANDGQKY
jgi:hypothetical protein